MSEAPVRVCLAGATGLVGSAILREAVGREDVRIIAIARRGVALPPGARMELLVGSPQDWPALIAAARADVLVSALGTTIRSAGSQPAFRAVDHDLVLATAQAARDCGITRMIAVSSIGADPAARAFYLRTKGEVEEALGKLWFHRLDLVRPGLLLGPRAEARPLERIARIIQPALDPLLLHGRWQGYRSIRAATVARAILTLCHETAHGRRVHEYSAIRALARRSGD
ncbi:NAD(P)H-binding protein [Novosphingobium colocasiae]|uniref:NAD(P)H-binding protein n=1 Tax=Novosphingobium colocasiae TaxID=1256513 RepID=UPI0035B001E1